MGLNEEIQKANEKIVSNIDDLSKEIVIKKYEPIYDKIKKIALTHMKEFEITEIKLDGGLLYFRRDGNFYSYSHDMKNHPLELNSLPIWYSSDSKIDLIPGFTRYHSNMNHILNDFKQSVQKSLASILA